MSESITIHCDYSPLAETSVDYYVVNDYSFIWTSESTDSYFYTVPFGLDPYLVRVYEEHPPYVDNEYQISVTLKRRRRLRLIYPDEREEK